MIRTRSPYFSFEKVTVALARGQEFNLDRKQVVLNLFSALQEAVSG